MTKLARVAFSIDEETVKRRREAYGILDLFGDFGGVQYILLLIGSFIVGNFSEFNFLIKAIQHLYKAKTADNNLFPKPRQTNKKGKRLKELE